eukprot:GDKJ01021514.1.p1 GENE.GDKJ01021514.1~~GDKJ01021514.1.p1  ORF type:complete len:167 (-),score=27.34 GDKJ01021514.1:86-586(-)
MRLTKSLFDAVSKRFSKLGVCGMVLWPKNPSSDANRMILMITRGKEPMKGHWSFPGGSLEFGETVKEATLRELKEECDIDAKYVSLVDSTEVRINSASDLKDHHILLHSVCEPAQTSDTPPIVTAGDDAASVKWMTLKELHKLEMDNKAIPGITALTKQGFERYWR